MKHFCVNCVAAKWEKKKKKWEAGIKNWQKIKISEILNI